ncbi:Hypothetical predicted protein [Podarcis lilfordi]|uniref:Uncharacterized protein n=1 Tax=Podarcis lilfordi TaxID=74358 RepID=A0AA35PG44_9SAUR|nr:Hypothetical predicted protein [Podarcis lilfordi]
MVRRRKEGAAPGHTGSSSGGGEDDEEEEPHRLRFPPLEPCWSPQPQCKAPPLSSQRGSGRAATKDSGMPRSLREPRCFFSLFLALLWCFVFFARCLVVARYGQPCRRELRGRRGGTQPLSLGEVFGNKKLLSSFIPRTGNAPLHPPLARAGRGGPLRMGF